MQTHPTKRRAIPLSQRQHVKRMLYFDQQRLYYQIEKNVITGGGGGVGWVGGKGVGLTP